MCWAFPVITGDVNEEENGQMPVYRLGNGDDTFDSGSVPDWTNDSSVFGGNGDDTIAVRGLSPTFTTRLLVSGGNGDDSIIVDASNSVGLGGNGDDTLEVRGIGSTLRGGNGDDLLVSFGGGSGMSPGNTLTGGFGVDRFRLSSGSGNLAVIGDAGNDAVVSDGDVFLGPIDVITDWRPGESIGLRNFQGTEDLPTPTRVQEVALIDDILSMDADRFRPVVGDGEYGVFQGTLNAGNLFTVDADGRDLFIVYDTLDGVNEANNIAQGSVVLLGVQIEQITADLFAPSTGYGTTDSQGSGGGPVYVSDGAGSGSSMVVAALDASAPSAMDLVAI